MIETTLVQTVAADPTEAPTTGRDRRRVLLVAGLGLAALTGVGALLLSGPDETVVDEVASPPAAVAAVTASPSPAETARAAPVEARTGRDPFVDPAPPATAVVAAPAQDGAPSVPGAVRPDLPAPGGRPGTGDTSEGTPPAAGPEAASTPLLLVRVTGSDTARSAVFRLGEEQVTAKVGDSFGAGVQLLLLSLQEGPGAGQWTAVVQLGQGDPFDVVTGTPVPVA